MRERDKKDKTEWGRKVAVDVSIYCQLVTCAQEQQLPLQSIHSLIDDSFCLKEGSALTLNMSNYSKYQKSDGVWYSPPFYLGDIAGMKMHLAVYPRRVHILIIMSLLVQNLKRDEDIPAKLLCGQYVQVNTDSSRCMETDCNYVCSTEVFCECDNFDKFCQDAAGTTEGLVTEYRFVPHWIAEKFL